MEAVFVQATGRLTVLFDKLLVTATGIAFNWRVFDGLFMHFAIAGPADVFMRTVSCQLTQVAPNFQAIHLAYLATPPDVIGRNGLPVAAFDPFPVTIV